MFDDKDKKESFIFLIFNQMTSDIVSYSYETWFNALLGAATVGLIGLLPIFVVPNEQTKGIFIGFIFNCELFHFYFYFY